MTTVARSREQVTRLLGAWRGGDEGAFGQLIPLVEPELHRLAHHYMSRPVRLHAANHRAPG